MALTSDTLISVKNRSDFYVGYPVPDGMNGQERTFAPGETKKITFEELQKLSWIDGGLDLLKNYLVIEDAEALDIILGSVEPEYYYTEEKVRELLVNGSVDQLLDTFDFGTSGVIDLIKKYAVELEIPDIRKRNIIKEKTGLDIDKAIYIKNEYEKTEDEETTVKVRRSAPVEVPKENAEAPARRATVSNPPKYRVVSK